MKRLSHWGLLSGLLLTSVAAEAGWTTAGAVTRFYASSSVATSRIYIRTTAPIENPMGCSNDTYRLDEAGNSSFDQMVAMLLVAQTTGKEIQLYISDTTCSGAHPKASHAIIDVPAP